MSAAENIFEMYCNDFAPKGPHGKTVEDVRVLIDKYADKPKRDRLYCVFKTLCEHKFSMLDDINRKRNNNR